MGSEILHSDVTPWYPGYRYHGYQGKDFVTMHVTLSEVLGFFGADVTPSTILRSPHYHPKRFGTIWHMPNQIQTKKPDNLFFCDHTSRTRLASLVGKQASPEVAPVDKVAQNVEICRFSMFFWPDPDF